MMKTRAVFAILIISLVAFSACSRANDQAKSSEDVAADFALESIDGEKVVLSEILKEKKVVLDFWASWCPYCVKAIPEIKKFYAENKDKVEVIGINIKESKAKVESFVKEKRISYPIVLDSDGSVAKAYNVRGIPAIVAVDKDSKILYYGHSIEEMTDKVDF